MNRDDQNWKAGAEVCKDRRKSDKGVAACAYGVWKRRCTMSSCPAKAATIKAGAARVCQACGSRIVFGPFQSGCVKCNPNLARPCNVCGTRVVECSC